MRLDKFLKVSRILKRRTVAKDTADSGRVSVNGKPAKPAHILKANDLLTVRFGDKFAAFKVLSVDEKASRKANLPMYEVIQDDTDE